MAAEDPPGRSGGCLWGTLAFWIMVGTGVWIGAAWAAVHVV